MVFLATDQEGFTKVSFFFMLSHLSEIENSCSTLLNNARVVAAQLWYFIMFLSKMLPPCCVTDNCKCQENNLIRRESLGLFKTWKNPQSLFHHLHFAGPAADRERTLHHQSDVARRWFTAVEFKPIAARYVSRRESSGSSGRVTHGCRRRLAFRLPTAILRFPANIGFLKPTGSRGVETTDQQATNWLKLQRLLRHDLISFENQRRILMEKVAATLSVYLHAQHGSSAGSQSSFPPNLTRKQWITTLIEYAQQWPEVLLLEDSYGCLTLDLCKLTSRRHTGVSSSTDDSSLPVQSTLIVRHVTKPGLGRGQSTAGGFVLELVVSVWSCCLWAH